jgi:endonuclease G
MALTEMHNSIRNTTFFMGVLFDFDGTKIMIFLKSSTFGQLIMNKTRTLMGKKRKNRKRNHSSGSLRLWLILIVIVGGIYAALHTTEGQRLAFKGVNAMQKKLAPKEMTSSAPTQQQVAPAQQQVVGTAIGNYLRQVTPSAAPEKLIKRMGYTVSYNSATRNANWVAWKLTPERVNGNAPRTDKFLPDPQLPAGEAATTDDYKGTGWDRGHLCPAGDNKWNRQAMAESFYLSNVSPQHHNLNRGDWNELEQKCRKWVTKEKCLYIVAGPIFYDRKARTIGKHRIAVPDAFFKVILAPESKKPKAIGFIYKNDEGNHPLSSYVNTIDEVERITGIDFFPDLPDEVEREVEAGYNLKDWR